MAGSTARRGGVSEPPFDSLNLSFTVGDRPEHVVENRRRLLEALASDLAEMVVPELVHGPAAAAVDARHAGLGSRRHDDTVPGVDALVTATPGLVLAVTVADCVPILLLDPLTPAVGVAHAGWRGTAGHAAARTVACMEERLGSRPADLLAHLGPSIGPASFEVGPDVVRAVHRAYGEDPALVTTVGERTYVDLWSANARDLVAAGLDEDNIETAALDTYTAERDLFSARRHRRCGRGMGYISLRTPAG